MHPEVTRYQPENLDGAGMSIAQGPDYNRRMYDHNETGEFNREDAYHNPDNIAQGSPFIQERPWYNYGPTAR